MLSEKRLSGWLCYNWKFHFVLSETHVVKNVKTIEKRMWHQTGFFLYEQYQ